MVAEFNQKITSRMYDVALETAKKLNIEIIVEKKGRILSRQGMQKLDKLATEILGELVQATPKLKIYS